MAGRHHKCNGHELGQTSRDGEGQGGLACCRPWGHKELDTTGRLNNNHLPLRLTCPRGRMKGHSRLLQKSRPPNMIASSGAQGSHLMLLP